MNRAEKIILFSFLRIVLKVLVLWMWVVKDKFAYSIQSLIGETEDEAVGLAKDIIKLVKEM